LDELFTQATPLPSLERVCAPAPHHELLILARRLGRSPGPLSEKHAARIDSALQLDPDAWEKAAAIAAHWRAGPQLAALRRLRATGAGRRQLRWWPRRHRRGTVIALCGLDGAGKSTQTELLAAALAKLGYDVSTEWTRITYNSALATIALPVKALLGVDRAERVRSSTESADRNPAHRLRQRSRLVGHAWVTIVAVLNALALRRTSQHHLRRGRVLIRDRYLLDSTVQLVDRYGAGRELRLQRALLTRLAPRCARCYFLDVNPDTAYRRKPEHFDTSDLIRQRELYLRFLDPLEGIRIDGERPAEETFAEIAGDVWLHLP
jgi:thymidylate kinase